MNEISKSCMSCGVFYTSVSHSDIKENIRSIPLLKVFLEFKGASLREEYDVMMRDE